MFHDIFNNNFKQAFDIYNCYQKKFHLYMFFFKLCPCQFIREDRLEMIMMGIVYSFLSCINRILS